MKLPNIIQAIHTLQVIGSSDDLQNLDIRHLLTDSRQLGSEAASTLFFALKTNKNDGAKYIPQLAERGVRAFVLEKNSLDTLDALDNLDNLVLLVVEDALLALQQLAAYKRSLYHGPVIGITGSNGKTVVKEWLYQLLKNDYHITRSPKSYNSQIGVPLSVWQLNEKTELAIFEAGISKVGEMQRLQPIIQPTIGVITYIGTEHGENFPSLEAKRAEKMQLFANCPTIIEDPTHQNIRTCAAVMRALGYDEETITQRILQQTHETILEVNLTALVDNVRHFRSLLQPSTRLTCMVKAFAYGAGSVDISRALQDSQLVDYLAVAVADEGVELRKAGITLPIIIMDPEVAALDLIIENNLQPNIYSFQVLEDIIHAAEAKGLEDLLNVETGDDRLYDIIYYRSDNAEFGIEFALTHSDNYGENCFSFVNGQYTNDGGTHLSAFKEGLLKAVNEFSGKNPKESDYKTKLQEFVQNIGKEVKYELISESGPDHDKHFVIRVFVDDTPYGDGEGTSKKKAEQSAAKIACEKLVK